MNTDDLIAQLATGAGPARRLYIARDLAVVASAGMFLCASVSLATRGLVPEAMWAGAALWTKLAYTVALAACGASLLSVSAFPGRRSLPSLGLVSLVGGLAVVVGTISILSIPAGDRLAYVMGKYALICPWVIPLLSLPTLFGLLRLTSGYAPTDLRRAGFAAGLLAGSITAVAYALSCREEAIGFVAVWYSVGILVSAGIGALVGPRLLRW